MIRWLYAFHEWAGRRVLDAAEGVDRLRMRQPLAVQGAPDSGSLHDTIAHLVASERHWLDRWLGNPRSRIKHGTDYADLSAIRQEWDAVQRERGQWLAGLSREDLEGDLRFARLSGEEDVQPLWQTLLHVSNHIAHHRAEVCVGLTALDSPAQGVDLLDWMREAK
jgi:uncharacterized damage-inducible protein DinB